MLAFFRFVHQSTRNLIQMRDSTLVPNSIGTLFVGKLSWIDEIVVSLCRL